MRKRGRICETIEIDPSELRQPRKKYAPKEQVHKQKKKTEGRPKIEMEDDILEDDDWDDLEEKYGPIRI